MIKKNQQHPIIFGEVLFDCFPDGQSVLGGAPFNVAWHLQAFGQSPLFISRVGDDPLGRKIREAMLNWGMTTVGLQLDSTHPTGKVSITIENDEPSFEILANQAYDFIDATCLPSAESSAILYHGSLALRNKESREALQTLKKESGAPVFVDVNLRAPWWNTEDVLSQLNQADWVKLNEDELDALIKGNGDLESKAAQMQNEYKLKTLFVTRGAKGAMACTDSGEIYKIAPQQNLDIVDTVGAGDAFSSVLLLGLSHQWTLPDLLERAQGFASTIVTRRGATIQDKTFYQPFIKEWPLS